MEQDPEVKLPRSRGQKRSPGTPSPGRLLPRAFYETRPDWVAPRLLGKLLVCKMPPAAPTPATGPDQLAYADSPSSGHDFTHTTKGVVTRHDASRTTKGFVTGHDFSRAETAHENDLGFSPCPDEPLLIGRIVEVEAYLGPHNDPPDPAAHSHRGPTPRNLVLFGLPGHAYVYSIYGKYFCLNISCEIEGHAGCVLLRALDPLAGIPQMALNRGLPAHIPPTPAFLRQLTSGPSRLCQALAVTRLTHNALDVTSPQSPLQVRDDSYPVPEAMVTPRIGINPSNEALHWPLRYVLPGNRCLSGPKSLTGPRIPIP